MNLRCRRPSSSGTASPLSFSVSAARGRKPRRSAGAGCTLCVSLQRIDRRAVREAARMRCAYGASGSGPGALRGRGPRSPGSSARMRTQPPFEHLTKRWLKLRDRARTRGVCGVCRFGGSSKPSARLRKFLAKWEDFKAAVWRFFVVLRCAVWRGASVGLRTAARAPPPPPPSPAAGDSPAGNPAGSPAAPGRAQPPCQTAPNAAA